MVAKKSEKKRNWLLIAGILIIIAGLVLGGILLSGETDGNSVDDNSTSYSDPTTGLQVAYSKDIELKANDPPVQGVIFNMTKTDPRLQVTAWYEDGETVSDAQTGGSQVNQALLDNFKAQLEENYPGAKPTDEKLATINGYPAAELEFEYKTARGVEMQQRVLILVKDNDTVARIAMLTEQKDYENLNQQYFDQIVDSAKFQ
jgi:hypothetical protein